MSLYNNEKFNSIKEKTKKSFTALMNSDKIDLLQKRDDILSLSNDDNTIEEIIFEYLKIENKINLISNNGNNEKKIIKLLNDYECCIEEGKFNNEFSHIYTKKSSKTKIFYIFQIIKDYRIMKENDTKIAQIEKIISLKPNKY